MNNNMQEHLNEAAKKFERCVHNFKGRGCSLDGYPVLDCPNCTSYKAYPQYIKSRDGYIGTFSRLEYGEFPVYKFAGGERTADNWELEHGSDNIEDLH